MSPIRMVDPELAEAAAGERLTEDQLDIKALPREATEQDQWIYDQVTTERLNDDQVKRITEPENIYARQREIVALHWHPEFVPVEMIRQRIERMFPTKEEELIIPTQHNVLTSYGDYTGVEVDCYSQAFNRKTQFLFHFRKEKLEGRGDVFKGMLEHTFKYRTSQLFQFIETLIHPEFDHHVQEGAEEAGTQDGLVEFTRIYVRRIKELIEKNERTTAPEMIRNKLLVNFFDMLRADYNDRLINHVQSFLRAVKNIVKRHFSLDYFYEQREVIDEARSLGACVVIPHPEQFWPILLEDLPIDGIEVWNPQSFEFTEFLINVVNRQNRSREHADRPILVTMGDDCHMGEKVKDPRYRDVAKAEREIGVQPPWDDMNLRKSLIVAGASRESLIREYKARLGS